MRPLPTSAKIFGAVVVFLVAMANVFWLDDAPIGLRIGAAVVVLLAIGYIRHTILEARKDRS